LIESISASNFKSLGSKGVINLKLKPLTLFTGPNSSGKSNILEAIAFFAQAARLYETPSTFDMPKNLNTIYRYGDIRQYPGPIEDFIVYKKKKENQVFLEINVILEPKNIFKIFRDSPDKYPALTPKKILRRLRNVKSVGYCLGFNLYKQRFYQQLQLDRKVMIQVNRLRSQISRAVTGERMTGNATSILDEQVFKPRVKQKGEMFTELYQFYQLFVHYIKECLKSVYLISGERGILEAQLSTVGERQYSPTWVGSNGQDIIEILSRCLMLESKKAEMIQRWANKFQLGDLKAGYIGRGKLESNFKDNQLKVNLNTMLSGLGSRQILSVITQIFWSEAGSTIMIEEPEISLHPENQVLLHELFSEAVSQGKQIICSTHSPFFVLALSKIVTKNLLALDKIAVYEVRKTRTGTKVKLLKLNKHGFIESGVPSFIKVEEELFQDWSRSLEEE